MPVWHGRGYGERITLCIHFAMTIAYLDDASDYSRQAARIARLLAERLGTETSVLRPAGSRETAGSPPGAIWPPPPGGWTSDHSTREAESPTAVLVPPTTEGQNETRLADLNAGSGPRLLVLPPPTPAHWPHLSPSDEAMRQAGTPLLVVQDVGPLEAWLRGEHVLRVVCAHDLTTTADDALRFVKQLCQLSPCEITVVHLLRSQPRSTPAGDTGGDSSEAPLSRSRHNPQVELAGRTARILGGRYAQVQSVNATGGGDSTFLQFATRSRADLIVAGCEPFSHPRSSGRSLLRLASTNLALVPAGSLRPSLPPVGLPRVLAVTDLRPADDRAIAHAFSLVARGGTVRLVHVVHPRALPDGAYDHSLGGCEGRVDHTRLVEHSHRRLQQLVPANAEERDIAVEFEVLEHRDPATAIADAAERFAADLVCVAEVERPAFLAGLLSHPLRTLLARSDRPVLILPPTLP